MKIQNVGLDNAYAIVRGWVSDLAAAATGLISVTDETTGTTVGPVSTMTLPGQLLNDGGGGNLVVDIQAVLTEYLNNSGVDLVYGDVVVIDSSADTAVTTTTTAQDTRQVGVVLANIGAAGTGPVQTGGVVQFVNTTASVTRGEFAETSTTAKKATQNATQRTGSFGVFLESGTTPTMLFLGANSSTAPGVYETVIEGGGSVIKAHGNMGATETFDPTDGNVHTGTLNANCTFTLNPPTDVTVTCTLELRISEDGTGGYSITWPGSVTWLGGTPVPSTTASSLSVYIIETIDGGTTWTGVLVGGGLTTTSFATPAIVLGTAAAAGSATTVIRSDSTIVAFDATVPTTSAEGDSAATGSAAVASRRDHKHGRESFGTTAAAVGTSTGGSATTPSKSDHVHATGAGTPTTSAVGDAAATGSGPAAAMTNHVHGREAFGSPVAVGTANADGAATTVPRSDHVHAGASSTGISFTIIGQETRVSDGSTTSYLMDNQYDDNSVQAFNLTSGKALVVTETPPATVVIGAAGTAGDTLSFAYAALAI